MEKTAYFDNAATTFPKPESVYEFMNRFYRDCGVNVGRGQYAMATEATSMISETRKLMLELLKAKDQEIIFTPSATEAINLVLRGIPITKRCNVYISPFEHNAVIRVLNHLQETHEIRIHQLPVDRLSLEYRIDDIKSQFASDEPSIVVVNHASNVCGIVAPIYEICSIAKKYNAITVTDLCQTAGLLDVNLGMSQIDYAIFAGHKALYGPFGVAGVVSSKFNSLSPLIYGGTGTDSANPNMPDSIPERFEAGSQNAMAIAGLNASLKWIKQIGITCIETQEANNHQRLIDSLSAFSNIKRLGSQAVSDKIGVESVLFDGLSPDEVGRVLNNLGVSVRTGLHCAPLAHKFLGTYPGGSVRFSVGYFNDDKDFEILSEALHTIAVNC